MKLTDHLPPHRSYSAAEGRRGRRLSTLVAGVLLAVAGLAGAPPVARALENEYAKIIVHLVPYTGGSMLCSSLGSKGAVGCDKMKSAGDLNTPYFAFVCVVDGDPTKGIAGLQFGVEYPSGSAHGVVVTDWNLCATLDFKSGAFPKTGGGNAVTWDATNKCQREEPGGAGKGVVAVAGYFYLTAYKDATFKLTRRPVDNLAKIADCSAFESVVDGFGTNFSTSHLGFASFSTGATVPGYNPCGDAKPTVKMQWGTLKSGEGRSR